METPAYYAILPANVRYDKTLRPMEKIMFAEITALSNKSGYCNARNAYFAELYEVDVKTVGRWIRKLEKAGYLDIDQDPVTGHDRKLYPRDKKVTPPVTKKSPPRDKKVPPNITSIILQDKIEYSPTTVEQQVPDDFDEVWDLYNYKQGKKEARRAWKRLSEKKKAKVRKVIPQYLTYLQHPKNHWRKQMLFSTFLNGEHWESDWSIDTVDNSITALIGGEQLSTEAFDKFSGYVDWVKDKMPGLYASCRLLSAKEYFAYAPGGVSHKALRQVMSAKGIQRTVTIAHNDAAEQIKAGKDVSGVMEILNELTKNAFA